MGPRFEIEAKIPDGVAQNQVPLMFQSLLRDRFKLAFHRVTEEQPVNALIVDKGGPRLKTALAAIPAMDPKPFQCSPQNMSCPTTITNYRSEQISVTSAGPGKRIFTSTSIGTAVVEHVPGSSQTTINAPDATLDGLAYLLQDMSFQPVVNMTALKGRFQIALEMSVDANALRTQAISAAPVGSDMGVVLERAIGDSDAALQKELQRSLQMLGLRLEQRKAPVEILSVDHLEKTPTEN